MRETETQTETERYASEDREGVKMQTEEMPVRIEWRPRGRERGDGVKREGRPNARELRVKTEGLRPSAQRC